MTGLSRIVWNRARARKPRSPIHERMNDDRMLAGQIP